MSGPSAGLLSALFMALCIPEIMMSSVLCTEVGTLTLTVASFHFFLRALCRPETRSLPLFSGLSLGLAALFRPVMLIHLPVLLIAFWVVRHRSLLNRWIASGGLLIGFLIVHLVLVGCFSIAAGRFTLLPLKYPPGNYLFLSGTNFESHGGFNDEDAEMYWSWPESERLQRSVATAIQRITTNPLGFVSLVRQKMATLLADNTYGSAWAFYTLDGPWPQGHQQMIQAWMAVVAQTTYVLTLMAGFIYFLFAPRLDRRLPLLLIAMIVVSVLPHVLLEAQTRYHHVLHGFLALAAGFGVSARDGSGGGS